MGGYAPASVGLSGLTIPTYNELLQFLIGNFISTFGSAVYLGPDSSDYQDIAIRALQASDVNEALQAVWLSFNPQYAVGASLDLLGKLIGTARHLATNSTVILTITGTPDTVITNGVVQDVLGNYWNLPTSVTIPSGGSVNVTGTAQEPGNITANPGTITTRSTPTAGWTGVTNAGAAIPGEPVEPDSEYRARLLISQAKPSLSIVAGTAAAVAAVSGVTRSQVYENPYDYTSSFGLINTSGTGFTITLGYPIDSSDVSQTITIAGVAYTIATVTGATTGTLSTSAGTQSGAAFFIGGTVASQALGPAHSITSIVENGTPTAITEAIYGNKNPGCLTNGTTTISIVDPDNGDIAIPISFDVLGYVQIYVAINVHALTGFTSATQAAIASDIVAYLATLGIGESVVFSELYGAALNARPNPDQPLFSIRAITSGFETAQTTGNTNNTSTSVVVTSTSGISTGETIVGPGIPNNTTVSSVGNAASVTIHAAGTGYTTASALATTGGSGSGLTVNITASGGNITAATIAAAGTGYLPGDIVTVVQGGASGGQLNVPTVAITISAAATATATAISLSFFSTGTSDIPVGYNQAAQAQATNVVVNLV